MMWICVTNRILHYDHFGFIIICYTMNLWAWHHITSITFYILNGTQDKSELNSSREVPSYEFEKYLNSYIVKYNGFISLFLRCGQISKILAKFSG